MKSVKKDIKIYEDNPFEDEKIAKEWINSIENEKGMIREKELLPMLRGWVKDNKPQTIVDIGMGQGGCADSAQLNKNVKYIGVEPSITLVNRAIDKNLRENREYLIGNAYELPLEGGIADAAFAINVWFHLRDLDTASKELARILKVGGKFYICTANPKAYDNWRTRFAEDAQEDDEKIDGKVDIPINPLSRNLFFKHSIEKITTALSENGLIIDNSVTNGVFDPRNGPPVPLFLNIFGHKE